MQANWFKKLTVLFITAVILTACLSVMPAAAEDAIPEEVMDMLDAWSGSSPGVVSLSKDVVRTGGCSLMITKSGEDMGRLDLLPLLQDGQKYEISFYVRQDEIDVAKGLTTTIKVERENGDAQYLNEGTYTNWVNKSEWTKITRPLDLTNTADGSLKALYLYFEHMPANVFYIDDVTVSLLQDGAEPAEIFSFGFEFETDITVPEDGANDGDSANPQGGTSGDTGSEDNGDNPPTGDAGMVLYIAAAASSALVLSKGRKNR